MLPLTNNRKQTVSIIVYELETWGVIFANFFVTLTCCIFVANKMEFSTEKF